MIENKKITVVVAALTLAACLFTGVFTFWPQALGVVQSSSRPEYFSLFDPLSIMTVDITADEGEWAEMLESAIDEQYISCDVSVNGERYFSVGIRPKGNSSLSTVYSSDSDRYSFKLEFDHYQDGQTCQGLDKFVLNNIQADATYLKEYLSYDLLSQMGVPAPLYCFAWITVNGEPWGLYLAVEALEESFAQRNFGVSYGQLYKPDSAEMGGGKDGGPAEGGAEPPQPMEGLDFRRDEFDASQGELPQGEFQPRQGGFGGPGGGSSAADLQYIDGDPDSYSEIFDSAVFAITESDKLRLVESLRKLNAGEDLENAVDVDEVLRYFACNVAMVNLDSYLSSMKHNYYLYEENGKLSMLPWDYNLSFAGFQSGSASQAVNYPVDTAVSGVELEERPILNKLLENETYLAKYHEYLAEIAGTCWNDAAFEQKVRQLDQLIGSYVAQDPTAFYTYDEYQVALEALLDFVSLRSQSILGQLYGQIPSTEEGQKQNPEALVDPGELQLSLTGQQGGGHEGGFGDARGERSERQILRGEADQAPPEGGGGRGEAFNRPERGEEAAPAGAFGPADRSLSSGPDRQTWVLLAVSVLSLVSALLLASRFRRRKI